MGIKSFVDNEGNRRWADEGSKAYLDHRAEHPQPAAPEVQDVKAATEPKPASPVKATSKASGD